MLIAVGDEGIHVCDIVGDDEASADATLGPCEMPRSKELPKSMLRAHVGAR